MRAIRCGAHGLWGFGVVVYAAGCGNSLAPTADGPRGGGRDGSIVDARHRADAAPRDAASSPGASDAAEPGSAGDAGPDAEPVDASRADASSLDAAVPACDYRFGADGVLRIEAEDLPLVEEWAVQSDVAGFSGRGYVTWTGASSNQRPGHGYLAVRLSVPEAGRYRLQWRNQIGRGTNTTEHNDTWVRFSGAADYYGKRGPADDESRRYPKPICDDAAFMSAVRETVASAECARGSTRDGWMKVYSSGAADWKWSTRTSDHDAHDIYAEFAAAGVYMLELSARADFHFIDRIVLHEEGVNRSVVEAAEAPTPCRH